MGNRTKSSLHVKDMAEPVVCYAQSMIVTNGVWQGENPLDYSLALFVLQLLLVVVTTRILVFILKPFRQPRVVSEILAGMLLGPSGLGLSEKFHNRVFPMRGAMVLETMANIGLLYFLFLVGLELDFSVVKRSGQQAMIIAVAGMAFPFLIGVGTAYYIKDVIPQVNEGSFLLFMGVATSVTAFPVLARILAEIKLLNSELGKLSLSAAAINDMCAWILLAIAIALAENKHKAGATIYVVLSAILFLLFCFLIVRPILKLIVKRTPEGESINDFYICLILIGVLIFGFITDAIGTHSIFGAFVFGLIIPGGPLGTALLETLEDFVITLQLPLFYAICGLKTNVGAIAYDRYTGFLFTSIILACIAKVVGTLFLGLLYDMPFRQALSLGLLMNTKGLIELIVLNVGKDHKVLDDEAFTLLMIAALVMTSITGPSVTITYKPNKQFISYKNRTIQKSKVDTEVRMLVCIHTPRNVPTIINLLEISNPTKRSPLCIYSVHLVELTGRASAMLIVHNTPKFGRPAINRTQAQSEHIINSFDNYVQHTENVTVQPLTAVSPYSSMHEDICNLAEDKRVTLIILPFHKQQTVDGEMEATNPAFRNVNQNVLANAPCSVGILIDRGIGSLTHMQGGLFSHRIVLLFFGGPDDREALAYAWRMSQHPGVNVTVFRFVQGNHTIEPTIQSDEAILTVITNITKEESLDDECINKFRQKSVTNNAIIYKEKVVNNGEETVAAIRSIDNTHDLYIVGRGQGMISPLTAGLTDWSECVELGAIGDLLASPDFAATVSVLVVQQYTGEEMQGGGLGTPDSSVNQNIYFSGIQNDILPM